MDFKNYLIFGISSIIGGTLGILISDEFSAKKLVTKGIAALMIGIFVVPAFMPYFKLPTEVWSGIIAVSSVVGVEIIVLLTKKVKEYITTKMN